MSSASSSDIYDVLVLGSGEAGKYIAWSMASSGRKTALVERRYIGGSCPNIACLPSKNIIHSAKVAQYARHLAEFGLEPSTGPVDMRIVRQRKRSMVDDLIQVHESRFQASGAELILGEGRFTAPRTLTVQLNDGGTRTLTGHHVVISTGSRSAMPNIPGVAEAKPLTHIEALELGELPDHLIILGGGYIGMEFAQAMRRFGSRVTMVEPNPRLLHREEPELSEALTRIFRNEGITIHTGVSVREVRGISGSSVTLALDINGQEQTVEGTHLLVATGRTPNTDNIGLQAAGVALTPRGHVQVNERLEATAPGVYAVGDCAGSPHFTHIAFDDHRIVRDNLNGKPRTTTGRVLASCLFTDPEFARVGLDEATARERGIPYRLLRLPMKAVLRTQTIGETEGFLKALISADDTILGFTALGYSAGELLAPVQLAITSGLPYTALGNSIFVHPTITEGLVYLFSSKPVASA
jgi:pyruvate/2-oxoglutarate dehydrogenase complex dihydrolipoamide dehydrogenase (E3) component